MLQPSQNFYNYPMSYLEQANHIISKKTCFYSDKVVSSCLLILESAPKNIRLSQPLLVALQKVTKDEINTKPTWAVLLFESTTFINYHFMYKKSCRQLLLHFTLIFGILIFSVIFAFQIDQTQFNSFFFFYLLENFRY